jgi:hypothetical protein
MSRVYLGVLNRWLLCIAVAGVLGSPAFGQIVVPNANANATGNGVSGPLPSSTVSAELQTVFNPSQFPAEPVYITGFAWRAAPGLGPLNVTITARVYASTSPNTAASLSTTFANNVGPDNTQVLSISELTFSGAPCVAAGPCPFFVPITFSTPFLYNPANGALLIDVQFGAFSGTGQTDVEYCTLPNCLMSTIFSIPAGSPTGDISYGGSITEITYTPASSFFSAEESLGGGVYYLQFTDGKPFGYYAFLQGSAGAANAWLYHFDLGYEYATAGSASGGIYLYDLASGHWWYSSSTVFPYLYDFTLNAWLYYFPNATSPGHYTANPRYFSNLTTGAIFTM